jgi:hypothetical protein
MQWRVPYFARLAEVTMSTWLQRVEPAPLDPLSALVMRAAACVVLLLLLISYFSGEEEVQHIHALLGYGLAAVLIAAILWELLIPHGHRAAKFKTSLGAARRAFRRSHSSSQPVGPTFIAGSLIVLVAGLALVAIAMLWLTHSFWSSVGVDEAHEAIAYLTLGLAVFYVAMVIVGSVEHVFRLLGINAKVGR